MMDLRTRTFGTKAGNRYWWFQRAGHDYVPPVFSFLTDEEWKVVNDWYSDTDSRFEGHGECNVPAITLIQGLVMGSAIRHVVQLGHLAGYSTLLLGFMMRRMNFRRAVISIDISPESSAYTQSWVSRAGLDDYVEIFVGDSADPAAAAAARGYLGAAPALVFVDSSHRYRHTLDELKLWHDEVRAGGLIVLHDASTFAENFDPSAEGGVSRALHEWLQRVGAPAVLLNGDVSASVPATPDDLVYGDPCGLALIQKPFQPHRP
jgi:predicted O-methyltransferase YrrM